MEKVKFIQVNQDALPIRYDGYGFCIRMIDALPVRKKDGMTVITLFCGWNIILPDGYIGEVYETPGMDVISGYKQQANMYITNAILKNMVESHNGIYTPKDDFDLRTMGFSIVIFPNGGLASEIFSPNIELISLVVKKAESLTDMEIFRNIPKPIEKTEKDKKTAQPSEPQTIK